MLRWRLASTAVILSLVFGLLFWDFHYPLRGTSGLVLVPLLLVCSAGAAWETLDLLASNDLRPATWAVWTGTLLMPLLACRPIARHLLGLPPGDFDPIATLGWPMVGMAIAVVVVFASEMLRYREPGRTMIQVGAGVLVVAYVGVNLAFIAGLRLFHSHGWGMVAFISTVLLVKLADVGAYVVGKTLGRNKLVPKLSPGKTVEGLLGGLVAACLAGVATGWWLAPALTGSSAALGGTAWRWAVLGLLLACAGLLGDLAESMIKRDMRRKDSSRWLPGLGGVLDILDSILFAAPVAYICWAMGLIGPLSR